MKKLFFRFLCYIMVMGFALKAAPVDFSVDTQMSIGKNYYQRKEYQKAFLWLRQAFVSNREKSLNEEHKAESAYLLALMYLKGEGTEQDKDKALYWLKYAARSYPGSLVSPEAQYTLSVFFKGLDRKKALYWLKQAAHSDHLQALFDLAERHFKKHNYKKSLKLWMRFIKKSSFPSEEAYSPGMVGDTKDFSLYWSHAHYRAGVLLNKEQYFLKAANSGHPLACYELGKIKYLKGDLAGAFQWFHALFFQKNPFVDSEEKKYRSHVAYWLGQIYRDQPERIPLLALDSSSLLPDTDLKSFLPVDVNAGMDVNRSKTFAMVEKHPFVDLLSREEAEDKGLDPRQNPHEYMADYWLHHAAQNKHPLAQQLLYQHRYKNATGFRKNPQAFPLSPEKKTLWKKELNSLLGIHPLLPAENNTVSLNSLIQKLTWQDFDLPRLMWIHRVRFLDLPTARYEWAEISYAKKDFKEAYQWFYRTLQAWKNKNPEQNFSYLLSDQEEEEQSRQAYYKMAHMVQHNLVPLTYALRHSLWSEELEKALEVPKFLPLVPSKIEEIRFFQSIPYWINNHPEDVRVLFSAFMYDKARVLNHPDALSSFIELKMQNLDKIHGKTPGPSYGVKNFSFLKNDFKDSKRSSEPRGGKCSVLFSKVRGRVLKK